MNGQRVLWVPKIDTSGAVSCGDRLFVLGFREDQAWGYASKSNCIDIRYLQPDQRKELTFTLKWIALQSHKEVVYA